MIIRNVNSNHSEISHNTDSEKSEKRQNKFVIHESYTPSQKTSDIYSSHMETDDKQNKQQKIDPSESDKKIKKQQKTNKKNAKLKFHPFRTNSEEDLTSNLKIHNNEYSNLQFYYFQNNHTMKNQDVENISDQSTKKRTIHQFHQYQPTDENDSKSAHLDEIDLSNGDYHFLENKFDEYDIDHLAENQTENIPSSYFNHEETFTNSNQNINYIHIQSINISNFQNININNSPFVNISNNQYIHTNNTQDINLQNNQIINANNIQNTDVYNNQNFDANNFQNINFSNNQSYTAQDNSNINNSNTEFDRFVLDSNLDSFDEFLKSFIDKTDNNNI